MFKRKAAQPVKPLLSQAFLEFVSYLSYLEPAQRVELEDRRAESIQEYFRNRSTTA
jgi:chromosome segregation and condensation protein ScpB